MTTHKEALKLALEALKYEPINKTSGEKDLKDQAITAIKEALAKLDKIAALQQKTESHDVDCLCSDCAALDDLDEALAQPEQEPVAGEPLPCPFCGHVGLNFEDGSTYRWGLASCGGCGASTGEVRREYPDQGKWHVDAIAEWNIRTTPPQRTWVGLTDEDYQVLREGVVKQGKPLHWMIEHIEAKLKEKNT